MREQVSLLAKSAIVQYMYVIYRLGSPYWEKLRPGSRMASGGPQTEDTVSHNTDQTRAVNNIFIFFLLRFKSFRKILLQPSNLCVLKKGAFVLMLFKVSDRLQTKTKHYNMIFNL